MGICVSRLKVLNPPLIPLMSGREAEAVEAALGVPVLRHTQKKPAGTAAEAEAHFGCACFAVTAWPVLLASTSWQARDWAALLCR